MVDSWKQTEKWRLAALPFFNHEIIKILPFKFFIMSKQTVTKRKRAKKHLFFVVATAFGLYKVFTELQSAVDCYIATLNSLPDGDSIKIGHFMWSDKDIEHFNLFCNEVFESSQNA